MEKIEVLPVIPRGQIITIKAGKYRGQGAKFVRWLGIGGSRAEVIISGKIRNLREESITGGVHE